MRNREAGWIVAAGAVLCWISIGAPLVPVFAAEIIGWRQHTWLNHAVEAAAVLVIAGAVILSRIRAGRPFDLPALWAMGAIAVLIAALGESLLIATTSADASLQDTYYVVVSFQRSIRIAAIFCLFAGFYALFPRITGWALNRPLAWAHFLLTIAGTAASLSIGFALRMSGPLRFEDFAERFVSLNRIATMSAYVAGAGTALFLIVLIEALLRRRPA